MSSNTCDPACTTRLIITRHGETDWNRQLRIQGITDLALNDHGREQAHRLGLRLARYRDTIDIVCSSGLSRSDETARIVISHLPTPPQHVVLPVIRERNFGKFEGLRWDEIKEKYPDDVEQYAADPLDYRPGDGESRADVHKRVNHFFDEFVAGNLCKTILIVTHGGYNSSVLKPLLGLPLSAQTPFNVDNCSLSIIDRRPNGTWIVKCLNDTVHNEDLFEMPEFRPINITLGK